MEMYLAATGLSRRTEIRKRILTNMVVSPLAESSDDDRLWISPVMYVAQRSFRYPLNL